MIIQWKKLLVCLAIPLAVGGLSALLTGGAMASFGALRQPPLSPPGWLFPAVWTVLYLLMGLASYIVYTGRKRCEPALRFYALQLLFNFLWPIFFFRLRLYLFAFVWLVILWVLILITAVLFSRCSKFAGCLLIPYLAWTAFAGYLNLAIYLLN